MREDSTYVSLGATTKTINNSTTTNTMTTTTIKCLRMNKSIIIIRYHDINYYNDIKSFLRHDIIAALPNELSIKRYIAIPANDMTNSNMHAYPRTHNNVTKVKPFAAHHLLLLDTTLLTIITAITVVLLITTVVEECSLLSLIIL